MYNINPQCVIKSTYQHVVEFEVLPSNPMFNDALWFYIIHVQVYIVTCTYQHVVEFEVLPSNPMFNDTLCIYIIHVQVYSVTCHIGLEGRTSNSTTCW
jgi:hypothetical protein